MATKQRVPPSIDPVTSGVNAFDDLADAIANPNPARPLRNAIGASGRTFCNLLGATPQAAKDLLGPGTTAAGLLCKPYWDKNAFSPPVPEAPFTGGQCTGNYTVTYSATAEVRSCSTGVVSNTRTRPSGIVGTTFVGPITAVYLEGNTTTDCGFGSYNLIIKSNGGSTSSAFNVFSPTTTGTSQLVVTGFNVSVARVGGGDTCGDPPEELRPGAKPPPTPPAYPSGEEPGTDPDGQPFFFVPPIPSPVPFEPPTDVPAIEPPADPGGGTGGGPSEPPTGTDGGEGSPNGEDDPFDEPPENERWVGACITLTEIPLGTGAIPSSLPERIFAETVGNIRLIFDSLSGSGYDTPIKINAKEVCVWEPVRGLEPTGIRVNLKPGFSYTFKKFSVPKEN